VVRSSHIRIVVGALSLLPCLALPSHALTWHVPTPECPSIQAGIDAASAGDTVLVACGTYYEHDITMKSGICLTSGTGFAACATIDAQDMGRVIYCGSVDSTTRIVGFTITGGQVGFSSGGGMYCSASSPTLVNLVFSDNEAFHYEYGSKGGGMSCDAGSSPTLIGVVFSYNLSQLGGGMYCLDSSPHLTDVTFQGNRTDGPSPYLWGAGGGMYCDGGSPSLTRVSFVGNSASGFGMAEGGGMYCVGCSAMLTNVQFSNNSSFYRGGGLQYTGGTGESLTLTGVTFSGNSAYAGGAVFSQGQGSSTITDAIFSSNSAEVGGAIFFDCSSPTLRFCTFSDNQAGQYAGAVFCNSYSSPALSGCTFYGNSGGMWCMGSSSPTLENTIVAFSVTSEAICCLDDGSCSLTCCDVYGNAGGDWVGCIAGQYGTNGNICADPLFCLWRKPDEPYSLRRDSPCAAANNAACGRIGAWGVGCGGPVSVERTSWGAIKAMFR
jgi:parallel beta-helix repeat protein